MPAGGSKKLRQTVPGYGISDSTVVTLHSLIGDVQGGVLSTLPNKNNNKREAGFGEGGLRRSLSGRSVLPKRPSVPYQSSALVVMPGHILTMLVTLVVFCCVVRSFADRCVAGNCEASTDGTYVLSCLRMGTRTRDSCKMPRCTGMANAVIAFFRPLNKSPPLVPTSCLRHGTHVWADGSKYDGQHVNGKSHGT